MGYFRRRSAARTKIVPIHSVRYPSMPRGARLTPGTRRAMTAQNLRSME